MGNCLRHDKASCEGEDWGSLVSTHSSHEDDDDGGNIVKDMMEEESLLGAKRSCPSSREVKITISKKELERLMKKVDVQGLSLEQVLLARMFKDGGEVYVAETEHHRPWRPVLQSIPEVN